MMTSLQWPTEQCCCKLDPYLLIRDKNGRGYRRRDGQTENQMLRAISYRWLVRWICGYLGWDNTRPLPSCVYNVIRQKYPTEMTRGYQPGQQRDWHFFDNIIVTCYSIKYHPLPHGRWLYSHWVYFAPFFFSHSLPSHLKLSINFHVACIHILWSTEKKGFIVACEHCRQLHGGQLHPNVMAHHLGLLSAFELNCWTTLLFNLKCTRNTT